MDVPLPNGDQVEGILARLKEKHGLDSEDCVPPNDPNADKNAAAHALLVDDYEDLNLDDPIHRWVLVEAVIKTYPEQLRADFTFQEWRELEDRAPPLIDLLKRAVKDRSFEPLRRLRT